MLIRTVVVVALLALPAAANAMNQLVVPWDTGTTARPILGAGFVSRTGQITSWVCVDGDRMPSDEANNVPFSLVKSVDIVTSTESYRKFFSASASASVGSGPFSASGSASYSSESTSNSYKDRLLAQELIKRETDNLLNPRFSKDVPKPGSADFRTHCGDRFVLGIIRGGRLQVEFSTDKQSDSSTITAGGALSVAYSAMSAGGSVTSVVSKASQHSGIKYRIIENGGNTDQPTGKDGKEISVLDIASFVDRYPDSFAKGKSHDSPVALLVAEYSDLDSNAESADPKQLAALDSLGEAYEKAAAFVSALEEIQKSKAIEPDADILSTDFGRVDGDKLNELIARWKSTTTEILNASRSCANASTPAAVETQCKTHEKIEVPALPRKQFVRAINSREWSERNVRVGVTGTKDYLVIDGHGGFYHDRAKSFWPWQHGLFTFQDARSPKHTELWKGSVPGSGCLVPPNTIVLYDFLDSELEDNWNVDSFSIVLFQPLFREDWTGRQGGCPAIDVGAAKRSRN